MSRIVNADDFRSPLWERAMAARLDQVKADRERGKRDYEQGLPPDPRGSTAYRQGYRWAKEGA